MSSGSTWRRRVSPGFLVPFFPENDNAGGSAICIHRDILAEEAIVTHLITCQGRDPSDHAAVRLVIQKPTTRGHMSKRIPSWMSKHPVFCSLLQRLHDDHRFSPDPSCALAEFKVLPEKAKKLMSRELSRNNT